MPPTVSLGAESDLYKQVSNWSTLPLSDLGEVVMGQSPPSSAYNDVSLGLPLVQGNADIKNRKTIARTWTTEHPKGCQAGDIVMTVRAPVGAVGIASADSCLGRGVCAIKPKIDPGFLYHALVYREADWERLAQGTTFTAANGPQVRSFTFAVPNEAGEQRAIAEVLTDFDALIDRLELLITKKRNVRKGVARDLLGGARRLPPFSDAWASVAFGSLFEALRSVALSRAQLGTDGPVSYIHYGDIHTQWNTWLSLDKEQLPTATTDQVGNATLLRDGDLVLADASEDVAGAGKAVELLSVRGRPVVAGLHTIALRPLRRVFAPGFPGLLQETSQFQSQAARLVAGLKVYGLSRSNLMTIEVDVPSLDEQCAIAEVLSDMDAEIEALEKRLAKTKDLKTGMAQELLSGRTRLV
jgi:type I restriction enzyme S subunit